MQTLRSVLAVVFLSVVMLAQNDSGSLPPCFDSLPTQMASLEALPAPGPSPLGASLAGALPLLGSSTESATARVSFLPGMTCYIIDKWFIIRPPLPRDLEAAFRDMIGSYHRTLIDMHPGCSVDWIPDNSQIGFTVVVLSSGTAVVFTRFKICCPDPGW